MDYITIATKYLMKFRYGVSLGWSIISPDDDFGITGRLQIVEGEGPDDARWCQTEPDGAR